MGIKDRDLTLKRSVSFKSGAWIGASLLIAMVGSAQALEATDSAAVSRVATSVDFEPGIGWGPSGFRCETRNRAREVSRRNFVIDRVTECLPLFFAFGDGEIRGRAAAWVGERDNMTATAELARVAPALSAADRTARRAAWSADRSRFGNAQHDRSLRAMRGRFTRARR